MKILPFFLITIILLSSQFPTKAHALGRDSAELTSTIQQPVKDSRVDILRDYLEAQNSPLADHAATFVEMADKYHLDWKLVAAISGLESGYGKAIPVNSYNAWGWGIYGDNVKRFESWDEAIATISQGLRENYIDKTGSDSVYAIGPRYAASPTWAVRVENFMAQIESYSTAKPEYNLSIAL